jgi:hypothetical protein
MEEFTSIDSFTHAISGVRNFCHKFNKPLPVLTYEGRVKLHGSNVGVRRTKSGKIQPQSRQRIIDVGSDNYGFAFFVETNKPAIEALFTSFSTDADVTLYGEWCGSNIQKSVALTECPKHWAIFAVKVDGEYVELDETIQNNGIQVYNINQIPKYEVTVDFTNPAPASEILSELTIKVEEECPWAKLMFGVSGVGEGLVWTRKGHPNDSWAWFKTKGLKHKGNDKTKVGKIKISDEKMESIEALAKELLPEWRLEQGITALEENKFPLTVHDTGNYLKWIASDILKEELLTIAASGFDWKQSQGAVMRHARNYFLAEIERQALERGPDSGGVPCIVEDIKAGV